MNIGHPLAIEVAPPLRMLETLKEMGIKTP